MPNYALEYVNGINITETDLENIYNSKNISVPGFDDVLAASSLWLETLMEDLESVDPFYGPGLERPDFGSSNIPTANLGGSLRDRWRRQNQADERRDQALKDYNEAKIKAKVARDDFVQQHTFPPLRASNPRIIDSKHQSYDGSNPAGGLTKGLGLQSAYALDTGVLFHNEGEWYFMREAQWQALQDDLDLYEGSFLNWNAMMKDAGPPVIGDNKPLQKMGEKEMIDFQWKLKSGQLVESGASRTDPGDPSRPRPGQKVWNQKNEAGVTGPLQPLIRRDKYERQRLLFEMGAGDLLHMGSPQKTKEMVVDELGRKVKATVDSYTGDITFEGKGIGDLNWQEIDIDQVRNFAGTKEDFENASRDRIISEAEKEKAVKKEMTSQQEYETNLMEQRVANDLLNWLDERLDAGDPLSKAEMDEHIEDIGNVMWEDPSTKENKRLADLVGTFLGEIASNMEETRMTHEIENQEVGQGPEGRPPGSTETPDDSGPSEAEPFKPPELVTAGPKTIKTFDSRPKSDTRDERIKEQSSRVTPRGTGLQEGETPTGTDLGLPYGPAKQGDKSPERYHKAPDIPFNYLREHLDKQKEESGKLVDFGIHNTGLIDDGGDEGKDDDVAIVPEQAGKPDDNGIVPIVPITPSMPPEQEEEDPTELGKALTLLPEPETPDPEELDVTPDILDTPDDPEKYDTNIDIGLLPDGGDDGSGAFDNFIGGSPMGANIGEEGELIDFRKYLGKTTQSYAVAGKGKGYSTLLT